MGQMTGQRNDNSNAADDLNKTAAGNPNEGQNLKDVLEANEWARGRSRGVEHGQIDGIGGHQLDRVQRWMDMTGWDGDLRWPPPGFMEEEAARNHRLDFFDRQQQRSAGFNGPNSKFMLASPLESHQDLLLRSTQEASARADAWMAQMDARAAEDRQRQATQKREDRDRQHAQQSQEQDREHMRRMQRAQFDHERRMKQMELNAQRRQWGF